MNKLVTIPLIITVAISILSSCSKTSWKQFEGGRQLTIEVESCGNRAQDEKNTEQIAKLLEQRARALNLTGFARVAGERTIKLQLPKAKDPEALAAMFGTSVFMEFKLVDEKGSLEEALAGKVPRGDYIAYMKDTGEPILLNKKAEMTGTYLKNTRVRVSASSPYISIEFNEEGSKILERLTEENIKRRLAILIDGKVYSAPVIMDKISGGKASITGRFTDQEAMNLAMMLRAGSYPARTSIVKEEPLEREMFFGEK